MVPRRFSQVLKSMLGDRVTVVVVPNAGHAFAPEQPKAMADAIATFAKCVYAEPAKQKAYRLVMSRHAPRLEHRRVRALRSGRSDGARIPQFLSIQPEGRA